MKKSFVKVACLFVVVVAIGACASQWQNRNTGEITDSMPVYEECKKEVPETALDHGCLNRCYTACGKTVACMSKCSDRCTGPTGRTIFVGDYSCNKRRAEADGWYRK